MCERIHVLELVRSIAIEFSPRSNTVGAMGRSRSEVSVGSKQQEPLAWNTLERTVQVGEGMVASVGGFVVEVGGDGYNSSSGVIELDGASPWASVVNAVFFECTTMPRSLGV